MEIKDNELLRQFEIITETGLVAIEYSIQERKLFLTKFCNNSNERFCKVAKTSSGALLE